jgi:hypothetical protein
VRAKQVVLVALPFVFLGTLPLLVRPDPEIRRGGARHVAVAAAPPSAPNAPSAAPPSAAPPKAAAPAPAPPPRTNLTPNHAAQGHAVAASQSPRTIAPQAPANHPAAPASQFPPGPEGVIAQLEADMAQAHGSEARVALFNQRLATADRTLLCQASLALLEKATQPTDGGFRMFLIERLSIGTDDPFVITKLTKLIDAATPRGERLVALQAIARGTPNKEPALVDKLTQLATSDADPNVLSQARAILATLGAIDNVPLAPQAPPPPADAAATQQGQAGN